MSILKVKFVKFEKALAMQVLEQTHRDVQISEQAGGIPAVRIASYAELGRSTIYLRGSQRESDMKVGSLTFNSNSERDAYLNRVTTALQAWVNECKKIHPVTCTTGDDDTKSCIFEA